MQAHMLKLSLILAGGIIVAAKPATAAVTYDEARVIDSTPIYRVVETSSPREECWEEEVARTERRYYGGESATPSILGAVIGGAVGNAVGHHKRNRQVGTVVGAILGGSIGADISRNRRSRADTYYETVEQCRTVYVNEQEEKLVGYDVRYSYNGSQHTVRMPEDPGSTVRVRVDVEPVL